MCTNTPGSRECSKCPAGYFESSESSSFGYYGRTHCVAAHLVCTDVRSELFDGKAMLRRKALEQQGKPQLVVPTDELGHLGELSVHCFAYASRQPSSTVRLALSLNDSSEARVLSPSSGVVELTPSDWSPSSVSPSSARVVEIVGVRDDLDDGDVGVGIRLVDSGGSSATEFRSYSESVDSAVIVNRDIAFPRIGQVSPIVSPLLGINITITGTRFEDGMKVTVSDVPSHVYSLSDDAVVFLSPRAPNVSANASLEDWSQTYRMIRLVNKDGGYASCPHECSEEENLFYVEECIPKGQWGAGLDCLPCPEGAICPGGYRIWPLPGYWIPTETSPPSRLVKCEVPFLARCSGGRSSECGTGYTGEFCSDCSVDHFKVAGFLCKSCRSDDVQRMLLTVTAISGCVFTVVFAAILYARRSVLETLTAAIITIQQVIVAAQNAVALSPDWVINIYMHVRVMLLDFSFVRPGCQVGAIPYPRLYLLTMLWVTGITVLCVLFGTLHQWLHRHRDGTTRSRWHWLFTSRSSRIVNGFVVAVHVTHLQVCVMTVGALYCVRVAPGDPVRRLAVERSIQCFQGDHSVAFIVAWIVLFFFITMVPLWWFYRLRSGTHSGRLATEEFRQHWHFLYRRTKPKYWWYRLRYLAMNMFFALTVNVLRERGAGLALFVSALVFAVDCLHAGVVQPMLKRKDNLQIVLISAAKTLVTLLAVVNVSDLSFAGLVTMVVIILLMVSVSIGLTVTQKIVRMPPAIVQKLRRGMDSVRGSPASSRAPSPKIGNRVMSTNGLVSAKGGALGVSNATVDDSVTVSAAGPTRFVPIAKLSPTDSVGSSDGTPRSRRGTPRKKNRNVVVVRQFSKRTSAEKYRVHDTGIELTSTPRRDPDVNLPSPVRRQLSNGHAGVNGRSVTPRRSAGSPAVVPVNSSSADTSRASPTPPSDVDDDVADSPRSNYTGPSLWERVTSRTRLFGSSSRVLSSNEIDASAWTSSQSSKHKRSSSAAPSASRPQSSSRMRARASVHSLRSLHSRRRLQSSPMAPPVSPGSVSPADTPPRSPSGIGIQSKGRSNVKHTLSSVSYGSWLATPAILEGDSSTDEAPSPNHSGAEDDNETKVQQAQRQSLEAARWSSRFRRSGTPAVVAEGDEEEEEAAAERDSAVQRSNAGVGSSGADVLAAAKAIRHQQLQRRRVNKNSTKKHKHKNKSKAKTKRVRASSSGSTAGSSSGSSSSSSSSSSGSSSDDSDDSDSSVTSTVSSVATTTSSVAANWLPTHARTAHLPPIPVVEHHGRALPHLERVVVASHPHPQALANNMLDVSHMQHAHPLTPPRSPFTPDEGDEEEEDLDHDGGMNY
eukprot:TRINITY_DN68023_c0_g2_i3.p1 TRINITY_DN68023_c0_g2~~TRINITY_DN68023_c0_g2_i3.p1  ORF type:complete len:1569 (+),score=598.02 TRINITY_DN68023_c0_g2_i3:697-4707(+)